MKRFVSMLIVMILLSAMAVPVLADGLTVIFTGDSLPQVGGFLKVSKYEMLDSDSISSEFYNALLESNVIYRWYKNDVLVSEGIDTDSNEASVYLLTQADGGCTIYVKMCFYADEALTMPYGEITSEKFIIPASLPTIPVPTITTTALPDATVGKAYYVKVECADPDASFSEFMGSQLAEFGLNLTQHGEIEGTPTKAGRCQVNIAVSGEGGEDSTDFAIQIRDVAPEEPETTEATVEATEATVEATEATVEATEATVKVTEATDGAVEDTEPLETYAPGQAGNDSGSWWIFVVIALAGIGLGAGLAVFLVKRKK